MGYTMAEKILMKNTGLSHLAPGDLIMTRPDMCMVHDIYTPFVVQKLDEMKFRRLADPEKAVIFLDHLCPTNQATGDPRHYHKGHELSDRFGIRKLHAGEGISHTLMHEYRYALPGTVVVATDSHTPTYGGGGCFCTGIGYTEMAAMKRFVKCFFELLTQIIVKVRKCKVQRVCVLHFQLAGSGGCFFLMKLYH